MFRTARYLAVAGLLTLPTVAAAQVSAEFTPQIGVLWPGRPLFNDSLTSCACRFQGQAETHIAFGATATVWVHPMFGLETAVTYAEPDFIQTTTDAFGTTTSRQSARLFYASERLRGRFQPKQLPIAIGAAVGAGLVDHGGNAFDQWSRTTNFMVTGSLDFSLRVTDHVALRTEFTAHSYSASPRFNPNGFTATSRRSMDYALMFGLTGQFGDD